MPRLLSVRTIALAAAVVWSANVLSQPGMTATKFEARVSNDATSLVARASTWAADISSMAARSGQVVRAVTTAHPAAPAAATAPAGAAAWVVTTPRGAPVTWSSCSTIHYVLNVNQAPPGTAAEVAQAFKLLSGPSGLRFVLDGYTNVIPQMSWSTTQFKHYAPFSNMTFPPVILAFASKSQSDLFRGAQSNVIAMTGPDYIGSSSGAGDHYISAQGVIEASYFDSLAKGFGSGVTQGEVLLYELSHVLGLGEGQNPADISYQDMIPRAAAALGPGDITALRALGHGACYKPAESLTPSPS